jgi:hypothetical protein
VFFVNNGDGTFGPPIEYMSGNTGTSVTAADVTGDGFEDVLVTAADYISILPSTCLP